MNAPVADTPVTLPVATDPQWYKDAIIYQLHVKSFFDSNNDGIGDFPGLISRLSYIAELGINTIWLLPFYPSPRRDDGYDIAEYTAVHPEYGTLDDVKRLIEEAHKLGMRVITELVINHTSDQHAWFQSARLAPPGSPERDFYVWSDSDQKYEGTRVIFIDSLRSNWTWDPEAKAYFWHRFYSHQPDLNFDNPAVLEAILGVMHFWLDMGIDGLRLDAVPYLVEREGTNNENLPETHEVLKRIRAEIDRAYPGRMLLAEANQWPEDTKEYFGQGDECHMAFHFPLMPRMYMALAREDRFPITDIMRQTPQIPDNCQWAIFLRNHDELTLEMVTDSERDYLWETYATDRRARLNLGIRRRLAPLLERDRRRIELMNCLLLSMPGAPVIYYGDEIGMGDNIRLGDRDGVRTPMQWSPDRNGGFSRADPAALALPTIMDALYGYETVNVEAQTRDVHSLLHWTRKMIAVRRTHAAFGRGTLRFLYPRNRKVLAYLRELDGEVILCVANVSRTPQAVELDLSEFAGRVPVELNGGSLFPPVGQLTYLLTLPPYGFYWFILANETEAPSWHTPAPEPLPDYVTVVLRGPLSDGVKDSAALLEHEALPPYLAKRRWFGAKDKALKSSRFAYLTRLSGSGRELLLSEVEVEAGGEKSRWLLPLSMSWEDEQAAALPSQLALARVRRGRRIGLLTDAFALPEFAREMLGALASGTRIDGPEGQIVFEPMPDGVEVLRRPVDAQVIWLTAEQSNSSLVVDDAVMLKIFRRIQAGEHPEAEMSRYLTSHGFANSPALLGEVARIAADGQRYALAIAQAFVRNQGDAWTWTLSQFGRALDNLASREATADSRDDDIEDYHAFAGTIGRQLGAMHQVLARPTDNEAFSPRTAGPEDVEAWAERGLGLFSRALDAIAAVENWDTEGAAADARRLLERRDALMSLLQQLVQSGLGSGVTRIHGDFHLGQVLIASGDAYIIDFEGEPARPLEERRRKASPMRDVAGLMRSFDYAAAATLDPKNVVANRIPPARRLTLVTRLRRGAQRAFLAAYREAAAGLPGTDRSELLDFFLAEKAAYEVCYEAANRPAWVPIPLSGLSRLAARLLRETPPQENA
ncbi:maltose alpha-D-glucosyltransferase [Reyranella sp.]|jgi:maltose alpha-D-glucosyltransferase/alpha-amylase|uniref:maltose alpha-D-glucosyltransferase n=1 Tax=Reyranella sp. TaxID=1929291 RepID=UPI00260F1092|nr:maltose alpha-D-glucosyltransferase [Reyranella sp.]HQS18775.1 maltose alpha-D-glucosyltransferase [Reyranella sp.]HQT14915.1 maltose alpha-D-glucosyltransferase [Reyranella sp.]